MNRSDPPPLLARVLAFVLGVFFVMYGVVELLVTQATPGPQHLEAFVAGCLTGLGVLLIGAAQ